MITTNTRQSAVSSGGSATAATSHQRTASISALPTRQPNNTTSPSQSPKPTNQKTALPQHFIVRPGVTKHTASGTVTIPGPIVPLVAVDQLPEWLDLFGVPRELSLEQTVGLTNLGTAVRSPEFYDVYMHGDGFRPVPVGAASGRDNQDFRREGQGQRREDKNNALLVPSGVCTSGPPSASSSTVSSPVSPLSSRMDLAAKSVPGSNQAYINDPDKKASGNTTNNSTAKKPPNTSPQPSGIMNLGLHQRLPSPTATGSTPPISSNPYPILHPSYPHPQLHPQAYPPSHPHAAYAIPPLPAPPSMHPADRMLYSWNPPSVNARKSNATTRPKSSTPNTSNPSHPNNNPNSNGAGGSSSSNSVYCKHWCHRGTCRWGAQCRYAHAMPATPEGLREVGLSHHPAWWTTAFNMAYGSGGFGAWYPPPPPPPHLSSTSASGKHYGRKAQKEREREREREQREREREREREKGAEREVGKGKEKDRDREDGRKGKVVDGDGNRGAVAESSGRSEGASQLKKDGTEGKAGVVGQEQRKPEPPKEEPKLVEI
ncbi:uncharacterized protein F4807DRAFT_410026 [Annulohypoxylon truncatum]|uniref:uncharacterized protein n=1 Tax=Annulohypoxylon truncatum TaxID=327061 RepID=UPI00200817B2|nr:uncharacterized protein F4807DRAFT_410026 [Annulohypoxylon truncatum]KAI1213982.1 hypothetical protein F4807DRAFT_410026 [Annulohypoxylon truncatum]